MIPFLKKKKETIKEQQDKKDIFDFLPEDVRQESDKYIKIIRDIFIDETIDKLALKAIKRFLSFIWDLPASSKHHHNKPFGLYLHSLESAAKNLREFEERLFFKTNESGVIDSLSTKKTKPIEQYSAFLSGLLTYLDEILMWKVYSKEIEKDKNELAKDFINEDKIEIIKIFIDSIQPNLTELVNIVCSKKEGYTLFLMGLLHDIGKVVRYKVSYQDKVWNPLKEDLFNFAQKYPEREMVTVEISYALHKKIAPIFLHRVISFVDYMYIGADNISEILSIFDIQSGMSSKYKFVTIQSDMESTKEAVKKQITQDFAGAVINEIRKSIADAKYIINSTMPGLWVQENYTAVSIMIINDAIRNVQNSKNFEGKMIDFNVLLREWIERKYIKAENWKGVWQLEIQTMAKPFIQKVVLFKNDILWQDVTPPGQCKIPISITIS